MFCRNCGKEVGASAAVCLSCGSAVGSGATFCSNCGNATNPNAAVCVQCGTALKGGSGGRTQAGISGKPGKVQAMGIYTLISGILNVLYGLGIGVYFFFAGLVGGLGSMGIGCLLWVFVILAPVPIIIGILEILYAVKLLPDPIKPTRPNKTVAILEICSVLWCGAPQIAAGIMSLVFYNDPEVLHYFEEHGA